MKNCSSEPRAHFQKLLSHKERKKKATKKRHFLSHMHLPFDQILYELYLAFEFLLYETLFKDVYFRNFCGTLWFFFFYDLDFFFNKLGK